MKVELKKITQENKADYVALCNSVDRKYWSDRLPHPYTEKAGCKREGKKLNGFVKDGVVYNLCVMGVLKEGSAREE